MASKGQEAKPLTVLNATGSREPFFLRKIARPTPWVQALASGDPSSVRAFLLEPDGKVSLWLVQNDVALRRVAIAVNEGRDSLQERITFLPILPIELESVGIKLAQTPGETNCEAARVLHFDASISEDASSQMVQMVLRAKRSVGTCTRGQMTKAIDDAQNDGCFAVVEDSLACRCGATRG